MYLAMLGMLGAEYHLELAKPSRRRLDRFCRFPCLLLILSSFSGRVGVTECERNSLSYPHQVLPRILASIIGHFSDCLAVSFHDVLFCGG